MKKLANIEITIQTGDDVVSAKILDFINSLSNEDKKELTLTYSSRQIFVEDEKTEKTLLKG
jgi:hypothetical protein